MDLSVNLWKILLVGFKLSVLFVCKFFENLIKSPAVERASVGSVLNKSKLPTNLVPAASKTATMTFPIKDFSSHSMDFVFAVLTRKKVVSGQVSLGNLTTTLT